MAGPRVFVAGVGMTRLGKLRNRSKDDPVATTGIAQIVQLVTQLRGETGHRKVANACVAVAENGGGFYDVEEAATAVTALAH